MDIYGIGNAIEHGVKQYIIGSRATGKTVRMMAMLKTGDTVVCPTSASTRRLECQLNRTALGVAVQCVREGVELDRSSLNKKGRTILSHEFIESYYLNSLRQATVNLKHLEIIWNTDTSSMSAKEIQLQRHEHSSELRFSIHPVQSDTDAILAAIHLNRELIK